MSDKLSEDWYCPTCEDYVSGESVTFEEVHVICGTFVGEAWQKTKAALEAKLSKMEELESERDMLRTVLNDTDKAELLEALEQSTKEALALRERVEGLGDALEHCGYDPTDCIDCGGPPHNEWCRFWKLRNVVPILFAAAEGEDDDYGPMWDSAPNSKEEA